MEAVNTHITQNNKMKHTFAIYRLLRPVSCKHAHSRGNAVNFSSALSATYFTQEGITWHFAAANSWIAPNAQFVVILKPANTEGPQQLISKV